MRRRAEKEGAVGGEEANSTWRAPRLCHLSCCLLILSGQLLVTAQVHQASELRHTVVYIQDLSCLCGGQTTTYMEI